MTFGRRAAAPFALVALLVTAPAFAEPTAADLASARELFKEGRALRQRGDLPAALEKLRAAHALGQTPITGIELARTYVLVGRLVDAHEVSLGVARLPVASDETERSATARSDAAKLASELEPRLASLVVTVKGLAAGASFGLSVDGQVVPPEAIGQARRADPGQHVAVLTLDDGRTVRTEANVREGESRALIVDGSPALEPQVPPKQELPPDALDAPRASAHRSPLLLATAASVTALAGLTGILYGIEAENLSSALAHECPSSRCGPSYYGSLDEGRRDAAVSTVAFALAGAGVAVMVYDVAMRLKKAPKAAPLTPAVGWGWVGAYGSF